MVRADVAVLPGPSVLFTLGRSLALGRRAGLVSVAGNNAGFAIAVVGVAFGIGALVAASHVAFVVLKVAGAAYLVYLGVQTVRRRKQVVAAGGPVPHRRVFGRSRKPRASWLSTMPAVLVASCSCCCSGIGSSGSAGAGGGEGPGDVRRHPVRPRVCGAYARSAPAFRSTFCR